MASEPGDLAEAAYELGWAGAPDHLAALVAEVEVRHDFDVGTVRWSPWSPCPHWGESSWQCTGELHAPGDVLECQLVVSEDHELVQTWRWQSNGREPAPWRLDDLRAAAVRHSHTAPKGHHPGVGDREVPGPDTRMTTHSRAMDERYDEHGRCASCHGTEITWMGTRCSDCDGFGLSRLPRAGGRDRRKLPSPREPATSGAPVSKASGGTGERVGGDTEPCMHVVPKRQEPHAGPERIGAPTVPPGGFARPGGSHGREWVDHEDYPCTIEEHHALSHIPGSSALRRYLTDAQPTEKSGRMGNAVGWLATTPPELWSAETNPTAAVQLRPSMAGKPGGVAEWEAERPGVIGLTEAEWTLATGMATALREDDWLGRVLDALTIQVEHTVLATHAPTGVRCKARPDLRIPGLWTGDLKITRETNPLRLRYAMTDFGYAAQSAMYHDIEASRHGLHELKHGHTLIVVSETSPHAVSRIPIDADWMTLGRRMLHAELALRAAHQQTGEWPGKWSEGLQRLPPPTRDQRDLVRRIEDHVRRIG